MSRQPTLASIIHVRDFVDAIADDPTRENTPNYAEIKTGINVFEEDGFDGPGITIDPIRTRICAYLTRDQRDAYPPDTFFYPDGRFFTVLSTDGTLEIIIHALSLMRYVSPHTLPGFDQPM